MNSGDQQNVLQRLSRIEGQIRGLQRMIGEEQPCADVLTQIAAVRGALAQVGKVIFTKHSKTCIQQALQRGEDEEEVLEQLLEALDRMLK